MKTITVKIKRTEGFQTYEVPVEEGEILSVMNILEYIYQNLDRTLAFFHHAACKQAACGKCLIKADGKTVLACKTEVINDSLLLEPWNEKVVRDLICR